MKNGLLGGGFGGPRFVGRPCRISAIPCSGGFPSSENKRARVEKAGNPYDIDARTDVPCAPCQHRVILVLGAGGSGGASGCGRSLHPHGVNRSPDRATGQESYGQRLPQSQETRASGEQAQTLSRTALILGDSRNPPVKSRRANEARTSARSCAVSISLHHRPLMRTVFTNSVEAIRLMTS